MLTQRVIQNEETGGAMLQVTAEPAALAELLALADELNLRSTIKTEGPIHLMNDPAGNGPGRYMVGESGPEIIIE